MYKCAQLTGHSPRFSPDGINYELSQCSFSYRAFIRTRDRSDLHVTVPSGEKQRTRLGKKSRGRIAKGSRLFRAPSTVCRSQLSPVKFRHRKDDVRDSPVRRHRVPISRARLVLLRHRRRHRGRFRRQKENPLTASLSLFNIPVISASRRATRECCLCTHPGSLRVRRVEPEIVPTRFYNGEYAAGRGIAL